MAVGDSFGVVAEVLEGIGRQHRQAGSPTSCRGRRRRGIQLHIEEASGEAIGGEVSGISRGKAGFGASSVMQRRKADAHIMQGRRLASGITQRKKVSV